MKTLRHVQTNAPSLVLVLAKDCFCIDQIQMAFINVYFEQKGGYARLYELTLLQADVPPSHLRYCETTVREQC